jgi:hypothetical protein
MIRTATWRTLVVGCVTGLAIIMFAANVQATEQTVHIRSLNPGTITSLLNAPHSGDKICDLADATTVSFIQRADHGPHKFAKIEVLDGDCSGLQGYVAWRTLDPEP